MSRNPPDKRNILDDPARLQFVKESPRKAIFYFSDDGDVMAVRNGDYKFVLAEQRATSTAVWQEPLVKLRFPTMFNLRLDPFERADFNSNRYWDWMVDHVPMMYEMQALVAGQIKDFALFPPRQKPASFNLDAVLAQVATHPTLEKQKRPLLSNQNLSKGRSNRSPF